MMNPVVVGVVTMIEVIGNGCIIDGDYLINVKDHMELLELPAPRKRLRDCDGSVLPLIGVECER